MLVSDVQQNDLDMFQGWKKIFHANGNQKKARVAILISDKKDFKIKTITGDTALGGTGVCTPTPR